MRQRPRIRMRLAAFTLIEMTVVLGGLGVLFTLGTLLTIRILRIQTASREMLEYQVAQRVLFDQFRRDVAQAAEILPQAGSLKSDDRCLILKISDSKTIVYRWEADRLKRWERTAPDGSPYWAELEPTGVEAAFHRGGPTQRLIALEIKQIPRHGTSQRTFVVSAALGGDLR